MEMLDFVQREMTDPAGGFYSALDAESEHEEGKFYRWDKPSWDVLPAGPARDRLQQVYGLNGKPNFEETFYVPQLSQPWSESAKAAGRTDEQLESELAPLRQQLLTLRSQRPRPLTDKKILTSWNGLMIRGFADAGRGLKQPQYVATARRAAEFMLRELRTPDGRLLRTYSQGQAKLNAYLDDYAFLVDGLIALHRATGEQEWLAADDARGGFFFTSDDHESLIARGMDPHDGAEPAGNSVAACNLVYLADKLGKADYRTKARRTVNAMSGVMHSFPAAAPRLTIALADLITVEGK
jgi:uncharacterized protein YyaL (SSP411 family)